MERLKTYVDGDTLRISTNALGYLPTLTALTALTALSVRLCSLHAAMPQAALMDLRGAAAATLAACVPCLVVCLSRMRPRVWEFDGGRGQVLLNGRPVCRRDEVRSVHLDRSHYDINEAAGAIWALCLRTETRVNIEIARDGIFGVGTRELQEKAEAICGHLGVAFVMPDRYVPGRIETPAPMPTPRRWGGKIRPTSRVHPWITSSPASVLNAPVPMNGEGVTFDEFAEELEKYQFRDWHFEPILTYEGDKNAPFKVSLGRLPCQSLGVKIRYTVEDNGYPGSGRMTSLQVRRFFDVSTAVDSPEGWQMWLRGFLWRQVRWILEHEAREQFYYAGGLPFDPHKATGGTLKGKTWRR